MNISLGLKTLSVGALTAASLLGGNAFAKTENLGAVTTLAPTIFSNTVAPGGFIDTYIFTLPANGGSGYSFSNIPVDLGGLGTLSLSFSAFTLYYTGSDGVMGGSVADTTVASGVLTDASSHSFSVGSNTGGVYYLDIFGRADGSLGGVYSGAISVLAAPVPEPETYAMLLAGLGVMGAIAVRRKKTKQD